LRSNRSLLTSAAEFFFDAIGVTDSGLELLQEVRHGR
jgi:hypothetical protein